MSLTSSGLWPEEALLTPAATAYPYRSPNYFGSLAYEYKLFSSSKISFVNIYIVQHILLHSVLFLKILSQV